MIGSRTRANTILCVCGWAWTACASADGKVIGTCKVEVVGAKTLTYEGKSYERAPPSGLKASSANSRAWLLKLADEIRPKSPQIANDTAKQAEAIGSALTFVCASDKGTLTVGPVGGAKFTDYPGGSKKYRAVSTSGKPGDLTFMAVLTAEGMPFMLMPSEPGEVNITQNDAEKLVGTFQFKSSEWTVKGSIDFARPKLIE